MILTVTIYYKERIQIKIKGKNCIGHSLGNVPKWSIHCSLLVESRCVTFLALMCDDTHGMFPIMESHLNPGVQSFYRGSTT